MKKKTIDVQDIEILNILAEHAELNNKELSKKIGLSEGPTLVRVQNLWERAVIKSNAAVINFQIFGYNKFYLFRVEVSDRDTEELKQRLAHCRYIILLIEMEATVDIVMRILIGVLQTKNLKTAKDELQVRTAGLKGICSVTMSPISFISRQTLSLDDKDVIK